jgi:hypothetical protein
MACPLHIYSLTGQEGLVELFLAFGLVGRQHLQGVVVLLLHSCAERWAFFFLFLYVIFLPLFMLLSSWLFFSEMDIIFQCA